MADLPASLRTLLDHARAEAKRAGHARTEPVHLAAALLRADADYFLKSFGPGAKDVLQRRLQEIARAGGDRNDTPETLSLLEQAAATPDPRAAVVQALLGLGLFQAGASASAPGAAAPAATTPNTAVTGSTSFTIPSGLSRFATVVAPDGQIAGREAIVNQLISLLGQRRPATPCILGEYGSGKSSLLRALAARLGDAGYRGPLAGTPVVHIRAEAIVAADRANALRRVAQEIGPQPILVLDDIEVLAALGGTGADLDMLGVIRSVVGDPGRRTVLLMTPSYFNKLEVHDGELAGKLARVVLADVDPTALNDVARQRAKALGEFHGVSFGPEIVTAALGAPGATDARRHPGLFIERLDHACARAAMRAERTVTIGDLPLGKQHQLPPYLGSDELFQRLLARVVGQDEALNKVAKTLALTRKGLDMRPERPDGVFLFVGPSGVGKTELARAMCEALFGDEEAMIRLDMSEYAQEWAISRLIGPQPGYVGYTEPAGWLTTRVRANPHSLVLLDEFEKADYKVWMTFLQVFDAGRLSDARGVTADFADTVIVLTSNLGNRSFKSMRKMGFSGPPAMGNGEREEEIEAEADDSEHVLEVVERTLPPEFRNRLDEIIVFKPLSRKVIHEIAVRELARQTRRLAAVGYELSITPEAIAFIAKSGYDPAYGARHLQRNITNLLLHAILNKKAGRWTVDTHDRELVWRQLG